MNCKRIVDGFVCRCGWRRAISTLGTMSYLIENKDKVCSWKMTPRGCLLVLE